MAQDGWHQAMFEVSRAIHDRRAMAECGLRSPDDMGEVRTNDFAPPDSQAALASIGLALSRAVMMRRVFDCMLYVAPPFCMLGLLDPTEDIRTDTLAILKVTWDLLLKLEEQAARGSQTAATWLTSLRWPKYCWVREIFIHLSEAQFLGIPFETVAKPLQSFVNGIQSTKIVADGINILRDSGRSGKAGTTGLS